MKPVFIALFMGGAGLLMVSCATVSKDPLPPGEIRLVRMNVPEADSIRANSPFTVYVEFESDGKPEIKEVCFTWSGDGPYCFRVTESYPGSPRTLKVQPRMAYPGSHVMEGFVFYVKDGERRRTNNVSTRIVVFPK